MLIFAPYTKTKLRPSKEEFDAKWGVDYSSIVGFCCWIFVDYTATRIQKIGQDGETAILAALTKNNTLADQVNARTSTAAVTAIVW